MNGLIESLLISSFVFGHLLLNGCDFSMPTVRSNDHMQYDALERILGNIS